MPSQAWDRCNDALDCSDLQVVGLRDFEDGSSEDGDDSEDSETEKGQAETGGVEHTTSDDNSLTHYILSDSRADRSPSPSSFLDGEGHFSPQEQRRASGSATGSSFGSASFVSAVQNEDGQYDDDMQSVGGSPSSVRACFMPTATTEERLLRKNLSVLWLRVPSQQVDKGGVAFSAPMLGTETPLLRHLYIEIIVLPRQARDRHRDS